MLTEVRARPVIGPVVSSERTTSRKGLRKTLGSTSDSSKEENTLVSHTQTQPDHRDEQSLVFMVSSTSSLDKLFMMTHTFQTSGPDCNPLLALFYLQVPPFLSFIT